MFPATGSLAASPSPRPARNLGVGPGYGTAVWEDAVKPDMVSAMSSQLTVAPA